jgi:hypothetical protein
VIAELVRGFGSCFSKHGNCAFGQNNNRKNSPKRKLIDFGYGKKQAWATPLLVAPLQGEESQPMNAPKKIAHGERDDDEPCCDDLTPAPEMLTAFHRFI